MEEGYTTHSADADGDHTPGPPDTDHRLDTMAAPSTLSDVRARILTSDDGPWPTDTCGSRDQRSDLRCPRRRRPKKRFLGRSGPGKL